LVYRRDGQKYTIHPRLRALHKKSEFLAKDEEEPMPPMPQPMPEQPPDGNPEKKPPRLPIPLPGRGGPPKPQIPEKYKHMLVKKEGAGNVAYANHYFNKLEQDRTLKAMKDLGDFSSAKGLWTLTGKSAKGEDFTAKIAPDKVEFKLAGKDYTQDLTTGNFENLPPKSGGLLAAFGHLHRMLSQRDQFTELYYLGSEPLDGQGEKVDVMVAVQTNVESRWYFHPDSGQLLGFDTIIDENDDECEIRIAGWKDFEGRKLPAAFTVDSGGVTFGTFEIANAELKSAE
jgi:hypothetical protein